MALDAQIPWCHTTDAYSLREILTDEYIKPQPCSTFNEDLTYFFLGRPAYRHNEEEQIRITAKAPVVIIFDNCIEKLGKTIYPFDSGAFKQKYSKWKHPDMPLSSFQMPCRESAPEKQLSEFFGTKENYLALKPSKPSRPYEGEFEVEAVTEILCDPSATEADDRRISVELIVDVSIPMRKPYLHALIIPERLEEAEWFSSWATKQAECIDVKTYSLSPLRMAYHYQSEIEKTARLIL